MALSDMNVNLRIASYSHEELEVRISTKDSSSPESSTNAEEVAAVKGKECGNWRMRGAISHDSYSQNSESDQLGDTWYSDASSSDSEECQSTARCEYEHGHGGEPLSVVIVEKGEAQVWGNVAERKRKAAELPPLQVYQPTNLPQTDNGRALAVTEGNIMMQEHHTVLEERGKRARTRQADGCHCHGDNQPTSARPSDALTDTAVQWNVQPQFGIPVGPRTQASAQHQFQVESRLHRRIPQQEPSGVKYQPDNTLAVGRACVAPGKNRWQHTVGCPRSPIVFPAAHHLRYKSSNGTRVARAHTDQQPLSTTAHPQTPAEARGLPLTFHLGQSERQRCHGPIRTRDPVAAGGVPGDRAAVSLPHCLKVQQCKGRTVPTAAAAAPAGAKPPYNPDQALAVIYAVLRSALSHALLHSQGSLPLNGCGNSTRQILVWTSGAVGVSGSVHPSKSDGGAAFRAMRREELVAAVAKRLLMRAVRRAGMRREECGRSDA